MKYIIVNGNYLLNKNDEVIINSNELGKLYICYNNYICYLDETIGYYYNQMKNYYSDAYPYIQCTFNSQSQCALIDIYKTRCSVPSDKDGSIAGAGELFITTEKDQTNNDRIVYNICLDTTVKQPISYPLGSTNKNSDYTEYIDSYELLISTSNEDSIFPYKPNKYLIGYVTDKTIKLECKFLFFFFYISYLFKYFFYYLNLILFKTKLTFNSLHLFIYSYNFFFSNIILF